MIRVAFLDIDNTLLSFSDYVREAMKRGFAKYDLHPKTDDLDELMAIYDEVNGALWRQLERGEMTFEERIDIRWNRVFAAMGIVFDGRAFERYFRDALQESAIPEPGAKELLAYLHSKYTLCAASNGPYEQQVHRLEVGGMKDVFAHCFISEAAGAQKPDPAFFDYCFAKLRASGFPNLRTEETMLIGDSLTSDIAGGKNYGMKTCWYRKQAKPVSAGGEPDFIVDHLTQIQEIL